METPYNLEDCDAFTSTLLNLAIRLDSFGKTAPAAAEAVASECDEEYAIVRP